MNKMKKVIEMLTVEIERIECLSSQLYKQGRSLRGLYRKNEAKQLRAIIEVMQKKT
jgi:hypothetical protein